jgi:hypothetical protein
MFPTHWTQNNITISGNQLHYYRTSKNCAAAPQIGIAYS